jgi:hypothetical protein
MTINSVPNISNDSKAYVLGQEALAEVHKAPKDKYSDDNEREVRKGSLILSSKDVVKDPFYNKGKYAHGGTVTHHTDHRYGEVGPDIGLEILKQS